MTDKQRIKQLENELLERTKELKGLYAFAKLIHLHGNDVNTICEKFVKQIIPNSMKYPDKAIVLLQTVDGIFCNTNDISVFDNIPTLKGDIVIFGELKGALKVGYPDDLPLFMILSQV